MRSQFAAQESVTHRLDDVQPSGVQRLLHRQDGIVGHCAVGGASGAEPAQYEQIDDDGMEVKWSG